MDTKVIKILESLSEANGLQDSVNQNQTKINDIFTDRFRLDEQMMLALMDRVAALENKKLNDLLSYTVEVKNREGVWHDMLCGAGVDFEEAERLADEFREKHNTDEVRVVLSGS